MAHGSLSTVNMPSILSEVLLIFILILANGLLSMQETALVSSRKTRLQQRAEAGDAGAKAALELLEHPNRFLASLQIGITLIGILAGAVGGATLAEKLSDWIANYPPLRPYADSIAITLIVLVITYFSLVLGELIPKRIALNSPERVAAWLSRPVRAFARLVYPLVKILGASTDLGLRLLGMKPSTEPPVTEEEIRVLLEQGTEVGVFEEAEQDMVESVFRLGNRRVETIMVPRTEIAWLDPDEPMDEILRKVLESRYSRFPVAQESLDNVIGILVTKELLAARMSDPQVDIVSLLHTPLFVPESTPVLSVLEQFRGTPNNLALVIDEYGGLQGLVTLHDIFEAIVGDMAAGQGVTTGAVQREDGSWLFDGMLPIDEFKDILDLDVLPEEERAGYQTVGGFVMSQIGSVPSAGEFFEWNGMRIEVMDMDGRRVDKVLVAVLK